MLKVTVYAQEFKLIVSILISSYLAIVYQFGTGGRTQKAKPVLRRCLYTHSQGNLEVKGEPNTGQIMYRKNLAMNVELLHLIQLAKFIAFIIAFISTHTIIQCVP